MQYYALRSTQNRSPINPEMSSTKQQKNSTDVFTHSAIARATEKKKNRVRGRDRVSIMSMHQNVATQ